MDKSRERTVSIAMTTYNGAKYIEKQLRSIFSQTTQPDEIVICDDCSQDGTVEIIRKVVAECGAEPLVRLVENQQNLGYIRNFHQAIGLSSGDYLFLADQDDEWYPYKLERMLEIMEYTGAEVICTGFDLIDENSGMIENTERFWIDPLIRDAKQGLTQITFHHLIFRNLVPGCTYCCTRRTAQVYLDIESQAIPHDYQIMFVGSLLGKVYFLNEKTICYRLHGNNTIGFALKGKSTGVSLKNLNKTPRHVSFLKDLERVLSVPNRWLYDLLFYLRIPRIIIILKKKLDNI